MTFKSRFGLPRQLTITRIGWFYVALTIGLGAAGINTGNNLVMLTCGVMLGLIVASGILSERCLRGLSATRELPTQLAAGSPSLVTLVLRNDKASASFGVLVSETSLVGRSQFPLVRAGASERRAYLVTPSARGRLRFGSLRISTRFPFGLFEKSLLTDAPQEAWVAPASQAGGAAMRFPREGLGHHGAQQEGQGLDPWELRLHREGEDARRIAWAQSARSGKLLSLTRERDGLAEIKLQLLPGLFGEARERHLAELRYSAETLLQGGAAVGLVGGGHGEITLVAPGMGDLHASRILEVLAREPGGSDASAKSTDLTAPASPAIRLSGMKPSRFIRWQRGALLALAGCAFASEVASRELPWQVAAAFGATWLYGLFYRERTSVGFVRAVNLASLVVLGVLAVATLARWQGIPLSAAEASLLLCANRLLARQAPGDDALLHLACFLVLAAAAALGGELEYGLCLLAFCALMAPSLTFSELRRGIEEEAPAQASALMAAPELTAPRLIGFTAALGLGSLIFAVALFPLFPRTQLGLLQSLAFGPRLSGVGDRVDLTATGDLQSSSKIVLDAEITAGDPSALHYFRTVTLERFTGSGWLPAKTRRTYSRVYAVPRAPIVSGILEPFIAAGDLIPVPEGLTELRARDHDTAFWLDGFGNMRLIGTPATDLAFVFRAAASRTDVNAGVSPEDTLLPEISPEVRALAGRVIPDGASPEEAVRRVAEALSGFTYQLNTVGGASPLDTFLRDRRGDCQLFATAAAVLLRVRGIPTRYVGGYYLDDPRPGKNVVRAWDAHAWTEVITADGGALLLDTTPASERGGQHRAGVDWWGEVQDLWQTAEFRWLRSVVDYDVSSQSRQARWLSGIGRKLWRGPRLGTWLGRLLILGLLGAVGLGVLRALRRKRDPALVLQARLFGRLGELGVERRPATTYDEALGLTEKLSADLARRSAPLLRRLGEARFGSRPLSADEEGALARAIDRLGG